MKKIINKLKHMDFCCLKFINLKLRCKPLDIIMTVITYLGSSLFSVLLLIFLFSVPKLQRFGKELFISLCVSNSIVIIIKFLTKQIRPFLKYGFLHVKTIGVDKVSSYPSGHTNIAFSIMTTVLLYLKTGHAFILLIIPFLVGISRVYLGVHYPSDIITGMFIGTLSPIIVHFI